MFAYAKPEQKSKDTVQKKDSEKKVAMPIQQGISAQLQALAYTQGNQVHVESGRESNEHSFSTAATVVQCTRAKPDYLNPLENQRTQTRHHIIPDTILQGFIEKIKTDNVLLYNSLIQAVEDAYIAYHGITPEEIVAIDPRRISSAAKKEMTKTSRGRFLLAITVEKTEDIRLYQTSLEGAFEWAPGNLVIGPTTDKHIHGARTEDPGNKLDVEAARISGISYGSAAIPGRRVSTGIHAIKDLAVMMEGYVKGTMPLDPSLVEYILMPIILRPITDGTRSIWR